MRTFGRATSLLACALLAACSSEPKTGPVKTPDQHADERDSLQATPVVPWPANGAGLKVGSWIEIRNTSAGKTTLQRIAITGDTGDSLQLEESGDGYFGNLEGLTVKKADGTIATAFAAKKGEPGKPIKIAPAPAAPANAPTAADESVTVPAGTFASTKTVTSGQLGDTTEWVGKEGDAKGIVVKWADDLAGTRELKAIAHEDLAVGGKPVPTLHATFTDGSEEWWVSDVPVPFLARDGRALVKRIRAGTTFEASWGDGAAAELDWGK